MIHGDEKILAEISEDNPERIKVDIPYRMIDRIKAVPGARWNTKAREWTVPKAWTACLALRAELGEYLKVGSDLNAWAATVAAQKNAIRALRGVVEGVELPEGFEDDPGLQGLYPHQKIDAQAILRSGGRFLLNNGMGTGKSRSALAGLRLLQLTEQDVFPTLIVAPVSMLRVWEDEIRHVFPDAEVRVADGTPTKIRKALTPGADFYVLGWDTIRKYTRLSPHPKVKLTDNEKLEAELNALDLKMLIADEAHRAKSVVAKRTRAAFFLAERIPHFIGLTGSPMQDTPEDLFALLHMTEPSEYPTRTSFNDRFIQYDWNMWGGREPVGLLPHREDEFYNNFNAVARRVTKDMVLDFLPEKVHEIRYVSLPAPHRKAYQDLEKTFATVLEESVLTVDNHLTLALRLLQLANAMGDMVYDEDPAPKYVMTADKSPKVDAFVDDYVNGDYDGEQIVVFSDSYQLLTLVKAALVKNKIQFVEISGAVTGDERKAAVDAFQAGEFPICLLTRAGGEGITLTAARTMVRLFRSWSLTVHQQVEDRVHRIGSEVHESIRYVDYLVEGTVEEGQMVRLNEKESRFKDTLKDGELLTMVKAAK